VSPNIHPELFSGDILLRGIVPPMPDRAANLNSTKTLAGSGKHAPGMSRAGSIPTRTATDLPNW